MKSPLVRWLVGLNVLILLSASISFGVQWHRKQQVQQVQLNQVVQKAWENDDASPSEHTSLSEIGNSVEAHQPLTDAQFSLLLTEIGKPNKGGIADISHSIAVVSLNRMKTPLTPSQRAILSSRLIPLLSLPSEPVTTGLTLTQMHKLEACDLLAKYDVRAAVPQIVPLLNDPNPQIRVDAKRVLKKLGYAA